MDRPSSRHGGGTGAQMARPSSRGGQYGGMAPPPPMNPMNPMGGAAGVREPPQMPMRPGTGVRALASRQGTARAGPVNTSGVGQNTSMNIADRPVTQQGLSGMRTAGLGPSRQIQDNSYYLQLMRAKCAEIQKETASLKLQIDQSQKDNAAYGQLERKYESLTKDMRNLEGKLADYNLMLDRTRVHKEVHDIMGECAQLAAASAAERQRVDEIFNHRQALEAQGREVENQLQHHMQEMARRLDSADPGMRETFLKLQEQQQQLSHEVSKKQADLNYFTERLGEMEQVVARDELRAQAYKMREDCARLERQQHSLAQELDGPQLTVPQQREMLLQKVKADNAEIAEAERHLAEMQEAVRRGRAQLSQLATDMSEANDPKAQKYQELFQRDKEMSELIDSFDEKKEEEVQKTAAAQSQIVKLLQLISRKSEYLQNISGLSADKLSEIKADLDFKQVQMDNSATTGARLREELDKRKVELDKIESLDKKISEELRQTRDKMRSMVEELPVLTNLHKLKEDSAQQRIDIANGIDAAKAKGAQARERAADLKARYEELKKQLSSDPTAVSLDELEQKMRHLEQTVFLLSEYIDTKGSQTNYQPVADQCMSTLKAINKETIAVLASAPVFNAASLTQAAY